MMDSNSKGAYAEYMFACECLKRGYFPSFPILDSSIYDVIVDVGGRMVKVQVKYSSKEPTDHESISVSLTNSNEYTQDLVDYFAIYSEYFGGFFIIKNNGGMQGLRLNSAEGSKHAYEFNNFSFDE